jgi:hypothetical protein
MANVDVSRFLPGGGDVGSLLGKAGAIIKYGIYAGMAIIGCILFYKFYLQYGILARVRIMSGSKIIDIKDDRAKKYKDKHGKWKLELFKLKKTLPLPDQRFKFKKGKKDYYELWMGEDRELHPTLMEQSVKKVRIIDKINNKIDKIMGKEENPYKNFVVKPCDMDLKETESLNLDLKPVPQDVRAFHFDEDKIVIEKYRERDKILQWATVAMPVVVVAFIFLILFFFFQHMGQGLNALAKSIAQVGQMCKIS